MLSIKQARREALERQVERVQQRITILQAENDRYSQLRMAVFLGGVAASLVAFYALALVLGVMLFISTVVVFSGILYGHRRVQRGLLQHRLWLKIKQGHVARMALDWEHIPQPPATGSDAGHPFEIDLDMTGERSLHQLVDTSVSEEGSRRLREWLLTTLPNARQIEKRQSLIRAMRPLVLFRDKLTLAARIATGGREQRIQGWRVQAWFNQNPPVESLRPVVTLAAGLAALNIVLFLLYAGGMLPPLWLGTFALYGLVWGRQWQPISDFFQHALSLYHTLDRLQAVFVYLETHGDQKPFREICQPFLDQEKRPSRYIRRINRVLAAASLQGNPILWLFVNLIVPWDLYFAHRLNQAKAEVAALIPTWLDAWYELEALDSLANFAYLNPDTVFPELMKDQPAMFEAKDLGHPLISDEQKVSNDFTLGELGELVIVTGSNMAGKSTFLRTLGTNLALAYAGGTVNASSFKTSLFRLYTCIKISDSINDGISYFYAEVKRLKGLLDVLRSDHPHPVFFLIDEIFRGTNNRERLIGSRSYIRSLVQQRGIGLLATHDLELVKLDEEFPQISNYHFREAIQDGRMVFDYQLRPGPCPTTNALKIMALEGLPIA